MKLRQFTILGTLLVFILTGTVLLKMPQFATSNYSNEPVPYIYYYSNTLNAFVIERADGSDSHLLGQNFVPRLLGDEYTSVYSIDWSPSGKWLSWKSSNSYSQLVQSWLLSTNGQEQRHIGEFVRVFLMQWASDRDWLIVGSQSHNSFNDNSYYYPRLQILDINHESIIFDLQPLLNCSLGDADVKHSLDDATIYIVENCPDRARIHLIDANGQSEVISFENTQVFEDYGNGLILLKRADRQDSRHSNWSIFNLNSREDFFVDELYGGNTLHFHWNLQKTAATVEEETCHDNGSCYVISLRYLDWQTRSYHDLPTGLQTYTNHDNYYFEWSSWSPDGQIVRLRNDGPATYLYNSSTQELLSVEWSAHIGNWYWLANNNFILQDYENSNIFEYGWNSQHITLLNPSNRIQRSHYDIPYHFELSSDEHFFAYTGLREVLLEDRISGERYHYPLPTGALDRGYIEGYSWDTSGSWFLTESYASSGGAGTTYGIFTIHHLTDGSWRELSLRGNAGFLPERVIPHLGIGQDSSYTQTPIQNLLHNGTVNKLAWSPDGSYIVSYSYTEVLGSYKPINPQITIWNVAETEPQMVASHSTSLECGQYFCAIGWENNQRFYLHDFTSQSNKILEWYSFDSTTGTISWQETETFSNDEPSPVENYRYQLDETRGEDYIIHVTDSLNQQFVSEAALELPTPYYNFYQFDYSAATGLLVASNIHGRGLVWDVATGKLLLPMPWSGYQAVFSPDGQYLAVAASEFISIWDMSEYIENR